MRTWRRRVATIAALTTLIAGTAVAVAYAVVTGCAAASSAAPPTAPVPAPAGAPRSLLERYSPIVRYAGGEELFAVGVEAFAERADVTLRRRSGSVIAAGAALRSLAARRYTDGPAVERDDALTVADTYAGWARRRDELRTADDVVYGRLVRAHDGTTYLQYWFFYVFNDSLPCLGDTSAGAIGDHEGDWELLQIRLNEHDEPDQIVLSQHKGAEARPWTAAETIDDHPVIYPGLGTHAGGFTTGCHLAVLAFPERGAAPDCNDGHGRRAIPTVRTLDQPWARWPGRWGTIASPWQTDRWRDPASITAP